MHSARRKAYIQRKKVKIPGIVYKATAFMALILVVFIFLKINTRFWNGQDKFGFAFRAENGDIRLTVLDPKLGDVTTISIPGDLEVDVAENYGTMRLKNVWQLGLNEKKGGRLVAESVTQNLLMPVFLWSDASPGGVLKFIFAPGKTNISIGDRIAASVFSIKIHELGRTEIDLAKGQYLKKAKLSDGEAGYIVSSPLPQRITVLFSDNMISEKGVRVGVTDEAKDPGVSEKIGQIIEVMGGKVVSVERKTIASDTDCTISGNDKKTVSKVATVLTCKITNAKTDFDLEITYGSKFARRF